MKKLFTLLLLSCFEKEAPKSNAKNIEFKRTGISLESVKERSIFVQEHALISEYSFNLKLKDEKTINLDDNYFEITQRLSQKIDFLHNRFYIDQTGLYTLDLDSKNDSGSIKYVKADELSNEGNKRVYRLNSDIFDCITKSEKLKPVGINYGKASNYAKAIINEDYVVFLTVEKIQNSYMLTFEIKPAENSANSIGFSISILGSKHDLILQVSSDLKGLAVFDKFEIVISNCLIQEYKDVDFSILGKNNSQEGSFEIYNSIFPEGKNSDAALLKKLNGKIEELVLHVVNKLEFAQEPEEGEVVQEIAGLGLNCLGDFFTTIAFLRDSNAGVFNIVFMGTETGVSTAIMLKIVVNSSDNTLLCYIQMINCDLKDGKIVGHNKNSMVLTAISLKKK